MRRPCLLFFAVIAASLWSQSGGSRSGGSRSGGWEKIYHQGELVEEFKNDDMGRPAAERIYHQGILEEERSYSYGKTTVIIEVRRHENSWTDTLYLREDGSLRTMERQGDFEGFRLGWSGHSTWQLMGDRTDFTGLDGTGRSLERTVMEGSEVTEKESFTYAGGYLHSAERNDYVRNEKEKAHYGPEGLLEETLLYRDGLLVLQTRFTYNEQNLPVEKISLGEGLSESWAARYDNDGYLEEESFFENGMITRRISYSGDERTEEIYTRGRLSLKRVYQGTELTGEERFD